MSQRDEQLKLIDIEIEKHKGDASSLMQVMQYSQDIMGYVPMDVQVRIAEGLGVTLSEVYG